MTDQTKRIAINVGGGYVPGLNAVITGAVLAASELGWETVGIRDGYEGLLFPDRYPDGGLVKLTPQVVENLAGTTGCIVGTAAQSDPFHVRTLNAEDQVEELDRSDELLADDQEGEDRCGHLRRRLPGAQHPLEAQPERAPDGLRAEVGRERCGRYGAVFRVQQHPELRGRDARTRVARRPSPPGGSGSSKSWASTRDGWRCRRGWPCAPMPCSSPRFLMTCASRGEAAGEGEVGPQVRTGGGGRRREAVGRARCIRPGPRTRT